MRALELVERIHLAVDQAAGPIGEKNRDRLRCARGCHACCVDELTVFEVEARAIVARHPDVLREAPHPAGACAFLDDDGACRIYPSRPYVCRTQGLPLRWLDDDGVERRDICALNEPGLPLESLPADACWPIGLVEERLATLQANVAPAGARVSLRSLFSRP